MPHSSSDLCMETFKEDLREMANWTHFFSLGEVGTQSFLKEINFIYLHRWKDLIAIYTCNSFILVFSLSPHPSKVFPELNREWLQGSSTNYCLCQGRWPLDVCAEKQNGEGWKVFQNFLGSPLSTLWEGITKSTLAWLKRQKQNKFSKHLWRTVMEPFNQVIRGLRFILKADQIQSAS